MVLAAHRNEVTERSRRRVAYALLTGAALLVLYWAAWLLDRTLLAADTRPAYYEFESAFVLGDVWLAGRQMDGEPFKVLEYSQKVMGRGGSIVNVKIKSLIDGKVLAKTLKGNESIEPADVTNQTVQYLYNDGATYFFMNNDTFEQFEIAGDDQ